MTKISISTATFHNLDFEKALHIIKNAGYDYIELTPHFIGGDWEIAQHLKDIKPRDVLKMVEDNGLKISTIHDCGGTVMIDNQSFIANIIYEYQDLTDDIECIVLHTPNCKTSDKDWWSKYKHTAINSINTLHYKHICFENLTDIEGFIVPLLDPYDLKEFVESCNCNVNIDTTHYGQCSYDIIKAAKILRANVKTIHLSDYKKGKKHLYLGDGELNLKEFFSHLDISKLYAITCECFINHVNCSINDMIEQTKQTRLYIEDIANEKQ